MDTEWVTREKKGQPISMLQLSTLNCTALVRLHLVEAMEYIPESLIQMLEDRRYDTLNNPPPQRIELLINITLMKISIMTKSCRLPG